MAVKAKWWLVAAALCLGAGTLIWQAPVSVLAAPARSTAGGISLSPFLQQVSLQPADAEQTFNLTITNRTSDLQELNLSAEDFGSLNDTGGLLFEGSKGFSDKYGLTSWLSLGADTVVLAAGESRSIPITVENRASLQPGGHYGAVVASVNSLSDQAGNHVSVNQQLVSLILVTKVGGAHYDLRLTQVTANGNWLHLPNTVLLRFQNPGNVHVVPRGLVKLKSPSGTVIAQGIINDESAFILPESFRELYVPLTRVGGSLPLPGLYHVEVDYRYDGLNRFATKTVAVRFIDLKVFVVIVLFLLAGWRYRTQLKKLSKKIRKRLSKKTA